MSIELITGASSTPHISANDYRAVNRSNYGQGRYVLRDAEEMRVSVAPASGIIVIDTGSVMWYGMHIRCESDTTLNYTPPTATTPVYVYMHYVKEADTGYESVDWVVSVGVQKTENNTPADNVIDAYTLFASFTHNPATQTADNLTTHFVLIDSHDDFNAETLRTEIQTKYDASIKHTNDSIKDISSRTALFIGGAQISALTKIPLKDSWRGVYRFIEFSFRKGTSGQVCSVLVPSEGLYFGDNWRNNIVFSLDSTVRVMQIECWTDYFQFQNTLDANIGLVSIYGYK